MRKKHLATRLDELERRVRELEARPLPMQAPVIVSPPTYAPYQPFQPTYPPFPIITCESGTVSSTLPPGTFVTGTTKTNGPHSVGITLTGGH